MFSALWDAICCYQYNRCSAYTKPKAFQLLILLCQWAGWGVGGKGAGRRQPGQLIQTGQKGEASCWTHHCSGMGVGVFQWVVSGCSTHHLFCTMTTVTIFCFPGLLNCLHLNPQTFTFSPHFSPQSHSHGKVKEKTIWCWAAGWVKPLQTHPSSTPCSQDTRESPPNSWPRSWPRPKDPAVHLVQLQSSQVNTNAHPTYLSPGKEKQPSPAASTHLTCSFPPATSAPLAAQFISQSPKSPPPALTPYAYYPHMSSPCSRTFWKGLERRRWSAGGAPAKVFLSPMLSEPQLQRQHRWLLHGAQRSQEMKWPCFQRSTQCVPPTPKKSKQGVVPSLPTPIIILVFKRGLRNRGHRHILEVLCHLCLPPHQTHFSV